VCGGRFIPILEFALALNPGAANGSPSTTGFTSEGGQVYATITFFRQVCMDDVLLVAQASATLPFGTDLGTVIVSTTNV